MEHIPQDYLGGDLSTKTIIELRELLDRQEKLLKKGKFIKSLPDGGQKVQKFAEKLKQLIEEKTNSNESLDKEVKKKPKSRFKKENEPNKPAAGNLDKFNLFLQQESCTVSGENQTLKTSNSELTTDEVLEDQLNSEGSVDKSLYEKTDRLSGLEETLEKMDIVCDDHSNYPAGEHILSVIERTHQNRKRCPLKLNRELKISKIEDLPPEFHHPGKVTGEKKICTLWKDTAVCPPEYKYTTAQEMSLQESMKLQENQKKKIEETQASYAAEKLAARLNIKMETFNPEGKDMSYREPELMDSDDDPDEVD